jgi:HD-GYP domain-containing protein (c-di-GMP phosphodiesterase class II)
VPDAILNKPMRLTQGEFEEMKKHVVESARLLEQANIPEVARMVAAQHHERYDGTGYPGHIRGNAISLYGQMASIVDVYDAISSNRVYHKGLSPSETLRKLLEWSAHHFDPWLVHNFIRSIGIYPAGSLVRLESQRLAIVREQNEGDLLHPKVLVIYQIERKAYLHPKIVNLSEGSDVITDYEEFDKWNINPRLGLVEVRP